MQSDWYKLIDKKPVKCDNIEELDDVRRQDRTVGKTTLSNGGVVSTVFLMLDHNYYGEGDPILFESMYFPRFPDMDEQDCVRYCTWEEAYEGHREMVEKYGGKVSPKDMFDEDNDLFKL